MLLKSTSSNSYNYLACIRIHKNQMSYSWGNKGFNTPLSVRSKTTIITSSVTGAGVDPPGP